MSRGDEADGAQPPSPPAPATLVSGTALACAAAAWFAWTASPDVGLLDSAELAAATVDLGISHPPGHPAWHLANLPWSALPIAGLGFRQTLASAFSVALLASLIPFLLPPAVANAPSRSRWWRAGGAFATAAVVTRFVLAPGVAMQAVRTEVYALQAVCVAAIVALALRVLAPTAPPGAPALPRPASAATWGLMGLLAGPAFATHHYLVVFAGLPVTVALLTPRARGSAAAWGAGVAAFTLGSLAWAMLPLRGAAQPEVAWAWPDSGGDLSWLVRAEAFQSTASRASRVEALDGMSQVALVHLEQLGPSFVLLGLAGAFVLARRHRAVAALVAALFAFNSLTQMLFDFDPDNPDVHGYFLLSSTILAALARVALLARPWAWVLAALLFVPWPASPWGELRTDRDAAAVFDAIDAAAPPEAALATTQFETVFVFWSARALLDARPDLQHVHLPWMGWEPPRRVAETRARAGSGAPTSLGTLRAAASTGRAVLVEAEPHLTAARLGAYDPVGPWLRLRGPDPAPDRPRDDAFRHEGDPDAWFAFEAPLRPQAVRYRLQAAWSAGAVACSAEGAAERVRCEQLRRWLRTHHPAEPLP